VNGFIKAGTGAAAAAIVAILVPVGIALAGYQDGGYSGTTDQTEAIDFRADDGKVRGLATVVYAECEDGPRQRITIERGRTEIGDERFSLDLVGKSDLRVSVIGKLRGERAWGRIEASMRPAGTSCHADEHWTASLAKG
jgi:hypothetical protein